MGCCFRHGKHIPIKSEHEAGSEQGGDLGEVSEAKENFQPTDQGHCSGGSDNLRPVSEAIEEVLPVRTAAAHSKSETLGYWRSLTT